MIERKGSKVLGDRNDPEALTFIGTEGAQRHDAPRIGAERFTEVIEFGDEYALTQHHALDMIIGEHGTRVDAVGLHDSTPSHSLCDTFNELQRGRPARVVRAG
jgi:hypothetical protein